jgi:DNA-binding NtrC family response regulator
MNHRSILVIDDEEVFAKNLTKLLRHRGYKASYVVTGSDAISELDSKLFDLVLLDLRMPGLNGVETCKAIFKRNPGIRVLVLTGHGAMDEAFDAMKLGASGYLRKPIEIEELVNEIEAE